MSKTLISVLVLGVVIVGGYFIIKSGKDLEPSSTINTEMQNKEQVAENSGKKMAFSEFIKTGGTYKCNVKQAMSDFENTGTVYIDGGKIRGEFSTIAEGMSVETSFISRDGYSYTWSSSLPEGFKVKLSADASASGTYTWGAEQIGDYDCEIWTKDETMFTIPADVTFREVATQQ